MRAYRKVLIPEVNTGQLSKIIRAEFLVDAISYCKVEGLPIFAEELDEVILGATMSEQSTNGAPGGNGAAAVATLTKKDFASDQETRWCPGCGDYAILATVQQFLPELGLPPERIVLSPGSAAPGASPTT